MTHTKLADNYLLFLTKQLTDLSITWPVSSYINKVTIVLNLKSWEISWQGFERWKRYSIIEAIKFSTSDEKFRVATGHAHFQRYNLLLEIWNPRVKTTSACEFSKRTFFKYIKTISLAPRLDCATPNATKRFL